MTDHNCSHAPRNGDDSLLTDNFGRRVDYLRVSVTDRCNFQCLYCMPDGGIEHAERDAQLNFDEIEQIVGIFARHGVRKVRLTGGEPLLRPELPRLIERLDDLPGLEHVAITTNAFLLSRHIDSLEDAGLTSINISLDTLNAETFAEVTQTGSLERVLDGIDAARSSSISPVKLNTVVVRGYNDDELPSLVNFAADRNLPIRFIEFMPIGQDTIWNGSDSASEGMQRCLPAADIRDQLRNIWELTPDDGDYGAGPAAYWRASGVGLPEDGHPIGVIGAVTECFCGDCNRMRLTATGGLRACLADDREISVRAPLRTHAEPDARREAVIERIDRALHGKQQRHDFAMDGEGVTEAPMTAVGG